MKSLDFWRGSCPKLWPDCKSLDYPNGIENWNSKYAHSTRIMEQCKHTKKTCPNSLKIHPPKRHFFHSRWAIWGGRKVRSGANSRDRPVPVGHGIRPLRQSWRSEWQSWRTSISGEFLKLSYQGPAIRFDRSIHCSLIWTIPPEFYRFHWQIPSHWTNVCHFNRRNFWCWISWETRYCQCSKRVVLSVENKPNCFQSTQEERLSIVGGKRAPQFYMPTYEAEIPENQKKDSE